MKFKDKLLVWLAWALPRDLVYWCAVRVGAHATQGQYGGQTVGNLSYFAALERWRPIPRWRPSPRTPHRPLTRFIH